MNFQYDDDAIVATAHPFDGYNPRIELTVTFDYDSYSVITAHIEWPGWPMGLEIPGGTTENPGVSSSLAEDARHSTVNASTTSRAEAAQLRSDIDEWLQEPWPRDDGQLFTSGGLELGVTTQPEWTVEVSPAH